jgi:hypothetical protein
MTTTPATCTHHWLIESPSPGVKKLPARCLKCKAERTFPMTRMGGGNRVPSPMPPRPLRHPLGHGGYATSGGLYGA